MSDVTVADDNDETETDSAAQIGAEDATNSKRRETKQRAQRRQQLEGEQFWRQIFCSEVGRREMWRLIAGPEGAHAFETRFMAGPAGIPDPNASWHARGEQDFGLRLYHAWLRDNPAGIALMHAENDPRFSVTRRRKASE